VIASQQTYTDLELGDGFTAYPTVARRIGP